DPCHAHHRHPWQHRRADPLPAGERHCSRSLPHRLRERGMKAFAELYQRLDRSTATGDKRAALVEYFRDAPAHDAAWALYLLSGGKVGGARRRIAASGELRAWLGEESGLPAWLVEDSYEQVGDLAETLTLLLDEPSRPA